MAAAIDDVTAGILLTNNAQNATSAVQGHTYLLEATRLGHQAAIDMRQSAALQEMRTSAQSREVLQTQAALNSPRQTAPAYQPSQAAPAATPAK